ncbi:MAG: V-type ATP synthase subunit D [Sulfolobaceae archaeon]
MSSQKVLPTKINLINIRRQLRLVRIIKRLLENKREVLLLYLRTYASEYEKLFSEVNDSLKELYKTYLDAVIDEGISRIESLAESQKSSLEVNVKTRVIFGVKLPSIKLNESSIPSRILSDLETSPYLVKSYEMVRVILPKIFQLIELESIIRGLASELRSTQKLINSIDNYILPFYTSSVRYIKGVLEDRAREEFTRLKMIRRILQRARESGQ